jgi:hypothetical protein
MVGTAKENRSTNPILNGAKKVGKRRLLGGRLFLTFLYKYVQTNAYYPGADSRKLLI